MERKLSVDLANLILAFSDSMDLASPDLIQHQQRTAFIAWQMAKSADLAGRDIKDLFVAALLHDIGAFSFEEKEAIKKMKIDNLEEHCLRGKKLLKRIDWLQPAAEIVRYHHTAVKNFSDDITEKVRNCAQILHLADQVERLICRERFILQQQDEIIDKIARLGNSIFGQQIIEVFRQVAYREEFWLDLVSPRLYDHLKNGPFSRIDFSFDDILLISELFRNIIDLRSRFTSTHSSGVSISAAKLAEKFGFTPTEVKMMKIAGNLHDIGKLAIPNEILNKAASLNREETAIMRSHTYYTYAIINQIEGMQQIAQWAAYHHEKLDGSGYPFHCDASELSIACRMMATADIFTALVEERPYRLGLARPEISRIFKQFVERGLIDKDIVTLLFDHFDEIYLAVINQQEEARKFYENQFAYKTDGKLVKTKAH